MAEKNAFAAYAGVLRAAKKAAMLFPAFLLYIFLLASCENATPPEGVIASVNGENIDLHYLQALMDSRASSFGASPQPSFDESRQKYGEALAMLVSHALVRQELATLGIPVSEHDLEYAINQIRQDFGAENLDTFLEDSCMRPETWRKLMLDHMSMETFQNRVLLPKIKIDINEAREYYNSHQDTFRLPEVTRFCFLTALERGDIEHWCENPDPDLAASDTLAQCVDSRVADLPPEWQKKATSLRKGKCSEPVEANGQWEALARFETRPGGMAPLSAVYALIEDILLEEKKIAAFDKWLQGKIATSKILIAPELRDCLELAAARPGEAMNSPEGQSPPLPEGR